MPELPEVEVTRLSFCDRIAGARILDAAIGLPLRWPLGCDTQGLKGRLVRQVRRRGKYLLLDMDTGMLLVHLGMSGSLRFARELPQRGRHDHFDLVTSQGSLRLHDPRRFGAVVYAEGENDPVARKLLGGLGVEPLGTEFEPVRFFQGLRQHRASIKEVLLAGKIVVGVGNIYACEALFRARIRPTTQARRIGLERVQRLHAAIREVLAQAVRRGGSTLRDFSSADGEDGHFQLEAAVYGRAGEPCPHCGSSVRSIRQGQRSTFFCPVCQRA